MRWTEHWRFETARLAVVFETAPCQDDPRDSFEFQEDIDAVNNGEVEWFDARVRVLDLSKATHHSRYELASDYLGCCAYSTVREFCTSHRDADPMNRNCSIMRAAKGGNVVICHYFPSMVQEAISAARERVSALPSLRRAWSGSPDPIDPDNFWIDDATGERVNAVTGERTKSSGD